MSSFPRQADLQSVSEGFSLLRFFTCDVFESLDHLPRLVPRSGSENFLGSFTQLYLARYLAVARLRSPSYLIPRALLNWPKRTSTLGVQGGVLARLSMGSAFNKLALDAELLQTGQFPSLLYHRTVC